MVIRAAPNHKQQERKGILDVPENPSARAGTKKRPVYHIVIADSRAPRDGRFIERLGYFNPLLPKDKEERLKFDIEKAKAWIAKGALPTDRVLRFLDAAGVMKREKRNNPNRSVPRKERKARRAGREGCRRGEGSAAAAGRGAGERCSRLRNRSTWRSASASPRSVARMVSAG